MTDTTPAPAKTATLADVTIVSDFLWVKTHVIIVLVTIALIAGSIIGGIDLFENLVEKHDARVAAQQQAKEGVDTATVSNLVAQLAQEHQEDATRDAAQTALLTSLVSQMSQQHAQTAKQLATDTTLDAQAAAGRLAEQTKAAPTDVTANNNAVTMTLPVTREVVADLDELPQAQADVQNLQSQVNLQKNLTTDAQTELSTANQLVAADKTELVDTVRADDAACSLKVDAAKKTGRKHAIWAAIGGFIGGVILGNRL